MPTAARPPSTQEGRGPTQAGAGAPALRTSTGEKFLRALSLCPDSVGKDCGQPAGPQAQHRCSASRRDRLAKLEPSGLVGRRCAHPSEACAWNGALPVWPGFKPEGGI